MHTSTPVLIVGGGPVGLAMASELIRHGVSCRVVEKLKERSPWSKAAVLQARILEFFENMGIIDEFIARGRKFYGANIYKGTELIHRQNIHVPGTSYPYMLGISQRQTEELLEAHLETLGGTLEREVELCGFQQLDDHVLATLRHLDTGEEETVKADWLIGCDGAHSTVRKQLDLPFEGSTYSQTLIHADIHAKFPFAVDPGEAIMFLSPDGPLGFLPVLEEGRYRVVAVGGVDELTDPTLDDFQEIARKRGPEGLEIFDPTWTMHFRFHSRIVPQYRVNRAFLAGDAAHIHSPAGAQGLNLGIHDAYNLAWKLALVHKGAAQESLLDSYDTERRPIADATVQTTDKVSRRGLRVMSLRNPLAQNLRNQAISFLMSLDLFQSKLFLNMSGTGLDYASSPIVAEHHISAWNLPISGKHEGEKPNLGDWFSFNKGPGPGERIADLDLTAQETPATLFGLLRGTHHTLLLFDGTARTEAGYQNLSRIASEVQERYGGLIQPRIIVAGAALPEALTWQTSVICDEDFSLHEHFASSTESLYLIRPDGYVGFRCQPALREKLLDYLSHIFQQQSERALPQAPGRAARA